MTTLLLPAAHRRRFEGLLQILRFNYPMFVGAALCAILGTALLDLAPLPRPAFWMISILMALGIFWAAAALAVSYLVYDYHPTFQFRWLAPWMRSVRTWANIHAGFDQTTRMLRRIFPTAAGIPIDLFDPAVMTEPSIHRARAYYPAVPGTLHARYNRLPLPDAASDAIFMLFAAHELRTRPQRIELFRQAHRSLKPGGILVLAEHLRGLPNFLAFGPGVFHFHSRREWLLTARNAGLTLPTEISLTPFATVLIWRKIP